MSAYVVAKAHIDAMIAAGLENPYGPLRWGQDRQYELTFETADEVGAMLWGENVKSVQYRYPEDPNDLPGPNAFTPSDADFYFFDRRAFRPGHCAPEKVMLAIHGYEYQTCEHPEWPESAAHSFCRALEREMISRLPGSQQAHTWSVTNASQVYSSGVEL